MAGALLPALIRVKATKPHRSYDQQAMEETDMTRPADFALACLVMAALMPAGGAFGQQPANGAEEFRNSCAVCHGVRGRGDGLMAEVLTRKPADLTVLERNNGGRFPLDRVLATIDGRFIVPGHGGRTMPIWGNVFREENNGADANVAQQKILALAEYIRSLQQQ
ncbi:c-type cytochrome [Mesorhizobium sp. KR1-2]|uniref:c-type cytochrome n=1 Tax=Mesorhizobium sp. KR1-2 TaxID=3156609 RepID=UPI0032B4C718